MADERTLTRLAKLAEAAHPRTQERNDAAFALLREWVGVAADAGVTQGQAAQNDEVVLRVGNKAIRYGVSEDSQATIWFRVNDGPAEVVPLDYNPRTKAWEFTEPDFTIAPTPGEPIPTKLAIVVLADYFESAVRTD